VKYKRIFLIMLRYLGFIFFPLILSCSTKTNYDLGYTLSSKEEVIRKTFEFISSGDSAGIDKILLSRDQHNTMFWNHVGELFASDKGMTANDAYNWMNMETKIAENELIREFKGKKLSIRNSECLGKRERYGPFILHLGCHITLADDIGKETESSGIRSILEYKGRFKLYHLRRE